MDKETLEKLGRIKRFDYHQWRYEKTETPHQYHVISTRSNRLVFTITFPEDDTEANKKVLKLAVSSKDLKDVVEMVHDAMLGTDAEKSDFFSIVLTMMFRLQ
ncbi:MAG: hypothetical protein AAF934_07775 [Bacteroidota bacterium]